MVSTTPFLRQWRQRLFTWQTLARVFSIQNIAFFIVLWMFFQYCQGMLHLTSSIIRGEEYHVLFDDAMISMTYAKNLAAGHGMVWNPGEAPVEGITNPLWTVIMAGWHLIIKDSARVSLAVQWTSIVLLAANLYFVRRIAFKISGSWVVATLAVFGTAFYPRLNDWAIQGMEVGLLAFMTTLAAWLALRSLERGRLQWLPYVVLGVATWVRMDAAVIFGALLVVMLFADRAHRREHLLFGIGLFALFAGSQTLLRLLVYGDFVPNTYHLKVEGYPVDRRLLHGAYVFAQFAAGITGILMFLTAFAPLRFKRDKRLVLLAIMFLSMCAYSIYVGGDAWEASGGANRYICVVMPLFFVLLANGLWTLLGWIKQGFPRTTPREAPIELAINVGIRVAHEPVVAASALPQPAEPPAQRYGAPSLQPSFQVELAPLAASHVSPALVPSTSGQGRHAEMGAMAMTTVADSGRLAEQAPPSGTAGTGSAYTVPYAGPADITRPLVPRPHRDGGTGGRDERSRGLARLLKRGAALALDVAVVFALVGFIDLPAVNVPVLFSPNQGERENWGWLTTPLHNLDNLGRVEQGLKIKEITTPQAHVAVSWAGIAIYFADRPGVDLLGKSDKVIAREQMRWSPGTNPLTELWPGHLKWDFKHSIGDLKPDVIAHLGYAPDVSSIPADAAPYVIGSYKRVNYQGQDFYFRNDSPYVLWDKVQIIGEVDGTHIGGGRQSP